MFPKDRKLLAHAAKRQITCLGITGPIKVQTEFLLNPGLKQEVHQCIRRSDVVKSIRRSHGH